jgi:hypothetical protein
MAADETGNQGALIMADNMKARLRLQLEYLSYSTCERVIDDVLAVLMLPTEPIIEAGGRALKYDHDQPEPVRAEILFRAMLRSIQEGE